VVSFNPAASLIHTENQTYFASVAAPSFKRHRA
jgi:hypothetical protein